MRISDWSSDVCSSDLGYIIAQTRAHDARHRRRPCLSPVAHRPTNILKCTSTYHRLRAASMLGANHLRDAASMGMMRIRPPVYRHDMAIDVAGIVRREKGDGSSGIFRRARSEEHTSELQSLMRISSAVFCLHTQTPNLITITDKLN